MAEILVLGAGMVGVTTALALQERGHDCVIVDRSAPGRETSYGNAGLIQSEAMEPYALPTNVCDLVAMAFGRYNAVSLSSGFVARNSFPLLKYWVASQPTRHARISAVWSPMIRAATRCHGLLAEAAGADHLLKKDGFWEAYRDARRLSAAVRQAETRSEVYGIGYRSLDATQLRDEEPALKPGLAGAIHWSDSWRCEDPSGLVEAYAQLFLRRGGAIIAGDAASLVQTKTGWRAAGVDAERVVLALGPWSPMLLRRFGYRVPMISKRGYHLHFKGDHGLRRSMLLADESVVLAPMAKGLRIATAAELTMSAPSSTPKQLARGEAAARSLLQFQGPVENAAWSGTRPCLPGMLPLVREAPRHPGLWMNFGHGHQGFTLGPVTAQKIASAMEGDASAIKGLDGGLR